MADSTTDNGTMDAKKILEHYIQLKNCTQNGDFQITVFQHNTEMEPWEKDVSVFVGCLGCGRQIISKKVQCPSTTPGVACINAGAWHFRSSKTKRTHRDIIAGRGRHRLSFDLADY